MTVVGITLPLLFPKKRAIGERRRRPVAPGVRMLFCGRSVLRLCRSAMKSVQERRPQKSAL